MYRCLELTAQRRLALRGINTSRPDYARLGERESLEQARDELQALQKEYRDQNVVWLSICSSAPGKQGHYTIEQWKEKTAERNVAATAVLLDPDGTVGRLYGARTTPHMYVINEEGTLVYMGGIDDKPTANSADIEGANNYVKLALNALLAGGTVETTTSRPYGCSVKY